MKELITLSFGNFSNYVLTHFWNLNDELLKNESNPLNITHDIIYDDASHPRTLLFDFSENIRPYYQLNEPPSQDDLEFIQSTTSPNTEVHTMYSTTQNENNFLAMLNELSTDMFDYPEQQQQQPAKYNVVDDDDDDNNDNTVNTKMNLHDVLKLPDDKLYEYLNFENNVHNWNDYLQPKLPFRSLNELKTLDVDYTRRNSYLYGKNFLHNGSNYNTQMYYDVFEDNFRHLLENCDQLEYITLLVDCNSLWSGLAMSFIEDINDMIPKVIKVINSVDDTSSMYNAVNSAFDYEKHINLSFFLSDIHDILSNKALYTPLYINETSTYITDVFNYTQHDNTPVYNYYITSLLALQLQTFHMPLRSQIYNKHSYIRSLMFNESDLNIFEHDLLFQMEYPGNALPKAAHTDGYIASFARDFKAKNFSWVKLHESVFMLNKHSTSIIYGYNDKYKIMGKTYNTWLDKLSQRIYVNEDKYEVPICFPRKMVDVNGKVFYYKDVSCAVNVRPYVDYCTKGCLKTYKNEVKEYKMGINKVMKERYGDWAGDYNDKVESVLNMIASYKEYAEEVMCQFEDSDDDEEEVDY